MRKEMIKNAKYIVNVFSAKDTNEITTISIFNNLSGEYSTDEHIDNRGIRHFRDVEDMRDTLNWNLNGDSSKFQFKWGQSGKIGTSGIAYVFD